MPSFCAGGWMALLLAAMTFAAGGALSDEKPSDSVDVPAFAAYVEPDSESANVTEEGISGWNDAKERIVWYGALISAGRLELSVRGRLPKGETSILKLTASKIGMKATIGRTATLKGEGEEPVALSFGSVEIGEPGYYRFALKGLTKTGASFCDLLSLRLSGSTAVGAKFNLKPHRNAASAHLFYPVSNDEKITGFYDEVTVRTEPLWSYYMACGFHRGYFGIQVNSPTERRIIFSVWDSGNEPTDRSKVRAEDRVRLLAKGDGVVAEGFGNEGTGGHSHLVYPWKKGVTYRLFVSAKPDGDGAIYSGYFYFPEKKRWGLIASFRAPKDDGFLKGLYSFNEDFSGSNGQLRRLAEFGPGWVRTADGKWRELTVAHFSHDETGKSDRTDYGAGAKGHRFYLSNGGFVSEPIKYGDEIRRTASGAPPKIDLPRP